MTRDEFMTATSRFERYRLAEETLRFYVYRWMENYVIASFVASLALPWLNAGSFRTLLLGNVWLVAVVGVLHHGKLVTERPWLLLAAAFEAGVLWALGGWWLDLSNFGSLCVFLFVLRYWMRGERDVNDRAFASA